MLHNTNELNHHGIPGMKWGVRRYQNKDGSLTPAGRRKAAKMKEQYTQLTGKKLIRKPTSKDTKSSQNKEDDNKKKKVKDLSDNELKDKVNRLQMEKQAIQLQNDLAPKGQKFISKIGKDVLAPAAVEAGKRVLTDLFTKYGKELTGLNTHNVDKNAALKKEVETLELERRKLKATTEIDRYKKQK